MNNLLPFSSSYRVHAIPFPGSFCVLIALRALCVCRTHRHEQRMTFTLFSALCSLPSSSLLLFFLVFTTVLPLDSFNRTTISFLSRFTHTMKCKTISFTKDTHIFQQNKAENAGSKQDGNQEELCYLTNRFWAPRFSSCFQRRRLTLFSPWVLPAWGSWFLYRWFLTKWHLSSQVLRCWYTYISSASFCRNVLPSWCEFAARHQIAVDLTGKSWQLKESDSKVFL